MGLLGKMGKILLRLWETEQGADRGLSFRLNEKQASKKKGLLRSVMGAVVEGWEQKNILSPMLLCIERTKASCHMCFGILFAHVVEKGRSIHVFC